eukprot:TRINITY_DN50254_c0_g1_i1.p1 TRINITY_DN50254_c0_g1~~TRINITY_DN50254_c0_g1_i1.p1  ORF type:complete len:788 (+),score=219.27 TRINITY_DN50254_c0_g1_i1:79-2442(+)
MGTFGRMPWLVSDQLHFFEQYPAEAVGAAGVAKRFGEPPAGWGDLPEDPLPPLGATMSCAEHVARMAKRTARLLHLFEVRLRNQQEIGTAVAVKREKRQLLGKAPKWFAGRIEDMQLPDLVVDQDVSVNEVADLAAAAFAAPPPAPPAAPAPAPSCTPSELAAIRSGGVSISSRGSAAGRSGGALFPSRNASPVQSSAALLTPRPPAADQLLSASPQPGSTQPPSKLSSGIFSTLQLSNHLQLDTLAGVQELRGTLAAKSQQIDYLLRKRERLLATGVDSDDSEDYSDDSDDEEQEETESQQGAAETPAEITDEAKSAEDSPAAVPRQSSALPPKRKRKKKRKGSQGPMDADKEQARNAALAFTPFAAPPLKKYDSARTLARRAMVRPASYAAACIVVAFGLAKAWRRHARKADIRSQLLFLSGVVDNQLRREVERCGERLRSMERRLAQSGTRPPQRETTGTATEPEPMGVTDEDLAEMSPEQKEELIQAGLKVEAMREVALLQQRSGHPTIAELEQQIRDTSQELEEEQARVLELESTLDGYYTELAVLKDELSELQHEREEEKRRKQEAKRQKQLAEAGIRVETVDAESQIDFDVDVPHMKNREPAIKQKEGILRQELANLKVAAANVVAFNTIIAVDLSCRHCLESITAPVALWPCGHTFCEKCVDEERDEEGDTVCPDCGMMSGEAAVQNHVLDAIAWRWAQRFSGADDDIDDAVQLLRSELLIIEQVLSGDAEAPETPPDTPEEKKSTAKWLSATRSSPTHLQVPSPSSTTEPRQFTLPAI